jgi:hypothetical protein
LHNSKNSLRKPAKPRSGPARETDANAGDHSEYRGKRSRHSVFHFRFFTSSLHRNFI